MAKKRADKRAGGKLWAVFGASMMGKGVWVKQQLRALRPSRLLVWDYLGEYAEFGRPVATLPALAVAVGAAGAGPVALCYTARAKDRAKLRAEFEAFCAVAYAAADAVVVCEELSEVTSASFAPPAWARLCNMGVHHRRLHVIGISQYPAQVDTSLRGSCTLLHVAALRNQRHRAAVAEEMDVPPSDIAALHQFDYIEKDFSVSPPALRRGRVTI